MGIIGRAVKWVKMLLGLEPRVIKTGVMKPRVIKRSELPVSIASRPRPGADGRPTTSDEVSIRVGELDIWVKSAAELDMPYELTVVVPRVEITRRYQDGKPVEIISTYSSVTIARSPRPE